MVYNTKLDKNKPQVRSQMIITQGDNVLYREPEQPIEVSNPTQIVKLGQLALAKVRPGRLADKKARTVSRRAEFSVVD